jgi:purine catabolism regulator
VVLRLKSYLTIREILKRRRFETAEVVAGTDGLNRLVKWVHVVEVIQIRKLLNGNELILTTGVGWKSDKKLLISLITQLIECNTSGLCIEMGTHTTTIPQEVIEIANNHQFPIILIHVEVPFVEITQDIHSLLINQHYQMISNLESYSQQLNKKLLEINHYEEILKLLHQYLDDAEAVALIKQNEINMIPALPETKRKLLLLTMKESQSKGYPYVARQPVQILGSQYAELVIITREREINEFDLLILDRTTTALAQHLLRDLYVGEKRKLEETEWMTDWLQGRHSAEEIHQHLVYLEPGLKLNGGIVCICKVNPIQSTSLNEGTYFKLLFRTIFEQHGFALFSADIRHHMIFILGNKRGIKTWKERMIEAFTRLEQVDYSGKHNISSISFGVGKFATKLSDIHNSYKKAKETLLLQDMLSQESKIYFYDDLHLYRIISLINKHSDLQEIVLEYLAPIMEYDKKYNGKLMETLKTYLACNGSKQETAKRLFVVRQTLYHRIEKLEGLLGSNFMSPEKRLAIEIMILASEYLVATEESSVTEYENEFLYKK